MNELGMLLVSLNIVTEVLWRLDSELIKKKTAWTDHATKIVQESERH